MACFWISCIVIVCPCPPQVLAMSGHPIMQRYHAHISLTTGSEAGCWLYTRFWFHDSRRTLPVSRWVAVASRDKEETFYWTI
ncbi:hypothetical protein FOXYSP1_16057 [Fusarium oxysporum f. sp. phaseoli]